MEGNKTNNQDFNEDNKRIRKNNKSIKKQERLKK